MDFTPLLTSLAAPFSSSELSQKKSLPFTVMLLSPHPDDECITSALALRLAFENNVHLINVAVTLGSDKKRQKARLKELTSACAVLEMEFTTLEEDWKKKEKELLSLIEKYAPQVILAPHIEDHHPTHVKTGKLLLKVLPKVKLPCVVAWTEFWGRLPDPNLLIEVPSSIVDVQMRALAMHEGEIKRNPYHLRLPAWMMDNVRRGSEIVSGKGTIAPNFAFGSLYLIQVLKKGKLSTPVLKQSIVDAQMNLGQIFKLILDAAHGSKTKVK